jgi:hypothetical protein
MSRIPESFRYTPDFTKAAITSNARPPTAKIPWRMKLAKGDFPAAISLTELEDSTITSPVPISREPMTSRP